MRLTSSILCTIVLAGCATHAAPVVSPVGQPLSYRSSPVDRMTPSEILDVVPGSVRIVDSVRLDDVVPAGQPMEISAQDVAREAIIVLGDSLFLTPLPALDSTVDEPTWDMDVRAYETQERVAHYVRMFTGKSKERITERLQAGTRYEPMIRAQFKAGGLPEDLYYLALVESGFNPNAYSRAAAVGMWQFMTSTGRGMGMRIDWWVDERRDPVRSTAAAVRFIRGLRDQFGSLYLAAAAYNGGPGRVSRGLARYAADLPDSRADDAFFVLADKDYLHNETREYVPQLIAAALVAKEPARYGMEFTDLPALAYDSATVAAGTPLAAVARAAGVPLAAIRELNPHFLRGMTPPGRRTLVRVPVGTRETFDSALAALPREERVGTHTVVTRKGQTVEGLASIHGIPASALTGFNPKLRRLKPSGRLVPGQSLLLPTPAVAAAALDIPDPAIEKRAGESGPGRLTHVVKRGETLGGIARKYGTTTERLRALNSLRKPLIIVGQSLIVAGPARRRSAARPTSAPSARSAKRTGADQKVGARAKIQRSVSVKKKSPTA